MFLYKNWLGIDYPTKSDMLINGIKIWKLYLKIIILSNIFITFLLTAIRRHSYSGDIMLFVNVISFLYLLSFSVCLECIFIQKFP